LFISSIFSARWASRSCTASKALLLDCEVAGCIFGQMGLHLGDDLGILALGVELLAASDGRVGGKGDAANGPPIHRSVWYGPVDLCHCTFQLFDIFIINSN